MGHRPMTAVINHKQHNIEGGTLIASDACWDGRSFERQGRNTPLTALAFLQGKAPSSRIALTLTRVAVCQMGDLHDKLQ